MLLESSVTRILLLLYLIFKKYFLYKNDFFFIKNVSKFVNINIEIIYFKY